VSEPATLLILAGGASRRMGRPKALLPVGNSTLIEWIARRLGREFERLLVAAGEEGQVPAALRSHLVWDLHPGAGPLAGIEAGLAASPDDLVVAVACDMPWVGTDLVRRLAEESSGHDAAVPRLRGRPEPACAAYRRSSAAAIGRSVAGGRLKAAEILEELDVRWLDHEPSRQFRNLNTPDEYERFLDAVRKKG
ncbi:MAG: molybdenum cofactor guanylyltransferase, partial [Candidatus Dormibacteraeota bacterium]|nr:molybdenum cofactor guanylyltransferase [Candidatus Dormibacteraeota bacterium]